MTDIGMIAGILLGLGVVVLFAVVIWGNAGKICENSQSILANQKSGENKK